MNRKGGSVYVVVELGLAIQLHLVRCSLHGGWRLALRA